jgi:integrase
MIFFASAGWETWDVTGRPAIPDRMPVLIDDDLLFEDAGVPRPVVAVNRWLRELPSSGAPATETWAVCARVLRDWMVFLGVHDIGVFDGRDRLKAALGAYAAHRADGPAGARFGATTWNRHMSVLSSFCRWALAEGHAGAVPFSYAQAQARFAGSVRGAGVNLARRRTPKRHVTIKYLEPGFADLFVQALAGLGPDGSADVGYRGRELARNSAVARLALATGLRRQEFTCLLACEIPPLPVPGPDSGLPIPFGVPAGVAKGSKFRTTWVDYPALEAIHRYAGLDRAASVAGSAWSPPARWGAPLVVTEPDAAGGRVTGVRVRWASLRPGDRRRLVAPGGGTCLLAARGDGGPFTAWDSVFTRAPDRIRRRFGPRFPRVHPRRLRHSFSMATLERLVGGYYAQAAQLVAGTGTGTGPDAALALYLAKSDPLMVLGDLLGHSPVLTTEVYPRRLDMTRIYRDACQRAGADRGPLPLVRDLLTGLAGLVHPHGPADAPGTVTGYLAGVRDLPGFLRARGACGGAGALTRAVPAGYWMQAGWRHEPATRRMPAAAGAATGVLRPEVRALVAGRRFAAMPVTTPLQPYTGRERGRLHRVCRQVADEASGRYRAARAGAAAGDDPRAAGWDDGNLRWLLTRLGPAGDGEAAAWLGRNRSWVTARGGVRSACEELYPTVEVTAACRLLPGMYSGIVPDGIADLGAGDIDGAEDATVLLGYVKRRTAAESMTLPRKAVRLLEQWLEHSALTREHAPAGLAGRLWLHYNRFASPRWRGVVSAPAPAGWAARAGVQADRRRVRTAYLALRDRSRWHGSTRSAIDPNHTPAVEGDHYLTATTAAQQDMVEQIIEDAQQDMLRRAEPAVVLTDAGVCGLAGRYPELISRLGVDDTAVAELTGGTRDVFAAACAGPLSGLHGPPGKPCPARPWVCLPCPLAVFTPGTRRTCCGSRRSSPGSGGRCPQRSSWPCPGRMRPASARCRTATPRSCWPPSPPRSATTTVSFRCAPRS